LNEEHILHHATTIAIILMCATFLEMLAKARIVCECGERDSTRLDPAA
jgi:hypothetical protein